MKRKGRESSGRDISVFERVWKTLPREILDAATPDRERSEPPPCRSEYVRASWRASCKGDAITALHMAKQALRESLLGNDADARMEAIAAEAYALVLAGDFNQAKHSIEMLELLGECLGDAATARAKELRGWWCIRAARWGNTSFEVALKSFEDAEAAYRRCEDVGGVLRCSEGRAVAEYGAARYFNSVDILEGVIADCLSAGHYVQLHRLALQVALAGKDAGYESFALQVFPDVIRWATLREDHVAMGQAFIAYADVLAHRTSDPERVRIAERLLVQAEELAIRLGLASIEVRARHEYVNLLRRTGRQNEAIEAEKCLLKRAESLPGDMAQNYFRREVAQAATLRQKLLNQIDRLGATLDSVEDAVLVIDHRLGADESIADYICETGNDAAYRLLGRGPRSFLLFQQIALHPVMRGIASLVDTCRTTNLAQKDEIRIEHQGEERYFSRHLLPLFPGMALCIRDVTARVQRANQLEEEVRATLAESVQLELQRQELLKLNRTLELLAVTDGLTGTLNHRAFQERLAFDLGSLHSGSAPTSLILFDVDHFKKFNDEFGHPAGDRVLKAVADTIGGVLRGGDVLARYGGEEFAVILPRTQANEAMEIAERIRVAVAHMEGHSLPVTVSLGVATSESTTEAQALLTLADEALYTSKRLGRNCVTLTTHDRIEVDGAAVPLVNPPL